MYRTVKIVDEIPDTCCHFNELSEAYCSCNVKTILHKKSDVISLSALNDYNFTDLLKC